MTTTRTLTVGTRTTQKRHTYKIFPMIRLTGDWLNDSGIVYNTRVKITSEPGRIIIEPIKINYNSMNNFDPLNDPTATKTMIKARKSFNYQCNKASKCRHEKYLISCHACPEETTCEIQKAIETARSKM